MKPVYPVTKPNRKFAGGILRQGGVRTIKKKVVLSIITVFFLAACQDQTDPRDIQLYQPGFDPESPLIGTSWMWDSGWQDVPETLYFDAETVLFRGQESYAYLYDKAERVGIADYLGRFTVSQDYERMTFSPSWRIYAHEAYFTRVKN